jgi:hypothetical protein
VVGIPWNPVWPEVGDYCPAVRGRDAERQWIWDHRAELERQAVAKFEAMEITDAGAVRSGTFTGLHQAKGSELALQVIGKHQLGR